MRVRGILTLCGLVLLPLAPLISQQTSQNSAPQDSSGSTLLLNFGSATSNPAGKAAVERLLQALGGAPKVDGVKSLRQTISALQQGVHVEVDQSIVYPDKQAQRMTISGGKTTLVVTPSDAFMIVGTQVQDMPRALRVSLDGSLKHDPINVLQHINDPKYIFDAIGKEKVDGAEATIVDVTADGAPTRWWIAADGKLLRERAAGDNGKLETLVYSDWKNFGGLQYPTKFDVFTEGGMPKMTMTLNEMQVNPAVSPKTFERPSAN